MEDVIIIGGGAAGLAAALYCARFTLRTTVIAKEYGGTGNIAHLVDNWIGEPGITGSDLMQKFIAHVKQYKVPLVEDEVLSVSKKGKSFVVKTKKKSYATKTVLFTNGMTHRKLSVSGEQEFSGKGVHYCYVCDGSLYGKKTVAVIGGSDAAALGTIFLSGYAKKVYLIYRGDKLRAEPISAKKVYSLKNVEVIHNANVVEVYGDKFVRGIKLDTKKNIVLDGIFIEIGHIPLVDLAKKLKVRVDDHGFIAVDKDQNTNMKGVFAAGDISNATSLKQFITSASEGSIAAQTIYHYLQKH
ncbi:FAD-dependent oxidoreductase [Candidatus Woesearchaeota archaeon]|nr:FAD-dependent oxidoreductase [Candidatus Woesearchaeota archaeon]